MIIDSNFQTPVPVCDYMVSLIPTHAVKVLEPTPGLGNIVESLKKENRFDIHTADDFFTHDKTEQYHTIIMNPPFSAKSAYMNNAPEEIQQSGMRVGYYILTECMKMSDNVIALMPWFTLSDSDVRLRYLKKFGMKSLTALPRKTFQYARIQTVVIELQKGFTGETTFKTFEWI